jgi:hypothetical protein
MTGDGKACLAVGRAPSGRRGAQATRLGLFRQQGGGLKNRRGILVRVLCPPRLVAVLNPNPTHLSVLLWPIK